MCNVIELLSMQSTPCFISDGENVDPMLRLREEIIGCYITESPDQRIKPLMYQHKK
jgi:hypothetical protein